MRKEPNAKRAVSSAQLVNALSILLLLALLFTMVIAEVQRSSRTVSKEKATLASFTYCDSLFGYVFRDETAIQTINNGPVDYAVASGTAVVAGELLAEVYVDDTGKDKRERAAVLYGEVARLEAALADTPSSWQGAYLSSYADLMKELSAGNLLRGALATGSLAAALGASEAAVAENADAMRARIAELQAQIEDLLKYADVPHRITAGAQGSFCYGTDGYEALFGTAAAVALTPEGLDTLLGMPHRNASVVGRLVETGVWYFAIPVSAREAEGYTVENAYRIHFDDSGENAVMMLSRVAMSEDGTRAVLVFRGDSLPEDLMLARRATVRVEKSTVSGLRVPASALTREGEDAFVFVEEGGVARRRTVTPILEENGCVLVTAYEKDATPTGVLAVGERVIVSVRRIYDGKALG